ncbi:tRNA glutamyl-Q(34) synthetase GluQRS [Achromobacter aloeverae]|uniref:Glutamyl-Q tRNA(Asp) synthetase n=1 Tax=Achromobacter aloeverae TaxID=1750518 RepID=A0A4Q1HJ42_9BURK|nr:tRNA glutamyl-Q(34) synthetase GluQRS [Achromobacter aloeverae]RXN90104.1 tRNA glutamyl-Q(34) synthetase GluQRS [Achromobacter aloeverae]
MTYVGRFAPSPSGPLHAGSLVAALASYLDARAADGRWLLRIEDVDKPRSVPGADRVIMGQLETLGLHWDGEVIWQSARDAVYQQAFDALAGRGLVYGCGCTRREIAEAAAAAALREDAHNDNGAAAGEMPGRAAPVALSDPAFGDSERPYAGTCRHGLPPGRSARAWRLRVPPGIEVFEDRWLGVQRQDVARSVGDFVLRRADGLWAYQLAVVVDDGAQGVTDIVRGADLLTSTARQRVLARMLGLAPPRVMHVPLVLDPHSGLKLSKQNHAPALDVARPLVALNHAWQALGFTPLAASDPATFLRMATTAWAARWTSGVKAA